MSAADDEKPGVLAGRRALVTGGAQGIGLAIARALTGGGARVTVLDNGASIDGREQDDAVLKQAASVLGEGARVLDVDVSDRDAVRAAVDMAAGDMGGLDIVVNNAAILRDGFLFKLDPADWDAVIATNLSAAFYVLSAASPHLRAAAKADPRYDAGRIVNIVSSAGFFGNFGQAAYASAKAGLMGLTRVAALDMARSGTTANAIAPFGATRVTESIRPANDAQAVYKEQALGIDAAHVGRFAAWLCSSAAGDVTGQLFGVRGRELFLFSQPRPAARAVAPEGGWTAAALNDLFAGEFRESLTDNQTDLEYFNTPPVI